MSAAKTGRGRKGGEENSRKRVLSRGAKKGPTVSLKMNCSGTLVEWNVFSREIKPRLALLPSRHRLDRNKRETGERDCVPAVIMVQRISPINLIVLRPPFAPSARRTELSSKPFCYTFPPSIRAPRAAASSSTWVITHMRPASSLYRTIRPIRRDFTSSPSSRVTAIYRSYGFHPVTTKDTLSFFLAIYRRAEARNTGPKIQ